MKKPIAHVVTGDCLPLLRKLSDASVHAIITDPPYGLGKTPDVMEVIQAWSRGEEYTTKGKGFMGQEWDAFVPSPAIWKECFRILKPGGHLLTFGGTRTFDLIALGVRLAGFDIRDCLSWLYGSGFPKGQNIGLAIDDLLHVEHVPAGSRMLGGNAALTTAEKGGTYASGTDSVGVPPKEVTTYLPGSPEGQEWAGWRTGLKPAWEPILMARKPPVGSVAANVFAHGTGAINMDGCRIEAPGQLGRWPANVAMDEAAASLLDAAVGERPGCSVHTPGKIRSGVVYGNLGMTISPPEQARGDHGGPSRFFYGSKASRAEREAGLEGPAQVRTDGRNGPHETPHLRTTARKNNHPTVKPLDLMQWLCRMVTPPGGVIVDPFCGSGTTLIAAQREGFSSLGIEQNPEYAEIARGRITGSQRFF